MKTPKISTANQKRPPALAEARGYAACPNCKYKFGGGEQVYECEVCGKDCCTVCTDTTAKHEVICDDCNEAANDQAEP